MLNNKFVLLRFWEKLKIMIETIKSYLSFALKNKMIIQYKKTKNRITLVIILKMSLCRALLVKEVIRAKIGKCLIYCSIILVVLTGCAPTKAKVNEPIIKELDHTEGKELFEINDDYKIYFYGVANLVSKDKLATIMIYRKKDSFVDPAYIEIIHDNQTFIVEMPILSSHGSEINKIYLQKITDFNHPQLIIDYCAGAAGTSGWTKESVLLIVSWIGNRFKNIFEHELLIENHYSYDKSVTEYTYEFISKDNVKTILLKDQDGVEEEYFWDKDRFKKR